MAVEIVPQEKINTEPFNPTGGDSPAISFEKNEMSPGNSGERSKKVSEKAREDRRDRAISKAIRDGKKIGYDSPEIKKRVEISHSSVNPVEADSWITLFQGKRQGESIQDIK